MHDDRYSRIEMIPKYLNNIVIFYFNNAYRVNCCFVVLIKILKTSMYCFTNSLRPVPWLTTSSQAGGAEDKCGGIAETDDLLMLSWEFVSPLQGKPCPLNPLHLFLQNDSRLAVIISSTFCQNIHLILFSYKV